MGQISEADRFLIQQIRRGNAEGWSQLVARYQGRLTAFARSQLSRKSEAEDLGKLMSGVTVTISQKAGENDQLFGSVTAKDVADALEKQGYTIDRRKVHLDEPIKQLGEHKVSVRLHRDVSVEVTVHVAKEE